MFINKCFEGHLKIKQFYVFFLLKSETYFVTTSTTSVTCRILIVFPRVFYEQREASHFLIISNKSHL